MRKILLAGLAVGTLLSASPAFARQGCGVGWHRDWRGWCVPNRRGYYVAPPAPTIGFYYVHRGWWDGHRYWRHRYWRHHGWRYR